MAEPGPFKALRATVPLVFYTALIVIVMVVPLLMPERLSARPVMRTVIHEQTATTGEDRAAQDSCVPDEAPASVLNGLAQRILDGMLVATSDANPLLAAPPPPPPPPPQVVIAAPEVVRIGGMLKELRAIRLVPPVYPPLAAKARVGGTVMLEAVVTEEGIVDEIRVISGHPLLIQAAIDCVRKWQYEPTMLNGTPVRVILKAMVLFNRPIT